MGVVAPQMFPGWDRPESEIAPLMHSLPPIPKAMAAFAADVQVVDTANKASDMLQLAMERRICHVGWDTEFRYEAPGVAVDADHTVYDVRSIKGLLLSLTLAESIETRLQLFRFVVDLRKPEALEGLRQVLSMPVPFVGHYSHIDLMTLWQLGLPEPRMLWDTWVAEKVAHLGSSNRSGARIASVEGAIAARERDRDEQVRNDLVSVCGRHGVPYDMASEKSRLQESFLQHGDGEAFTYEQIRYASLDATAAAMLYPSQVMQAIVRGDLQHLIDVEMRWVVVNARVTWNGVRIDASRRQQIRTACERSLPVLEKKLAHAGIANFRSHPQLHEFFKAQGLLELFRDGHKYSFDKEHLKEFRGRHPVIDLLYEARRIQSLHSDKALWPELVGADGRVHADHRQLGAASGRQSCRHPNLLGLDRHMRPLIVPDEGNGIGEVDLSQIEVGIAAAVYGDDALMSMFNSGDVYSEMAKLFHRAELSPEALAMSGREFKKAFPAYRDRMKVCTLGIIYGLTAFGLALRLDVSKPEATGLLNRFMAMFPVLRTALEDTIRLTGVRGYSVTATGLKRRLAHRGPMSGWDRNWARNHPVQGTAAALFKVACIRLDALYRPYGAKLILPVHDAVVFECPLAVLTDVGELTRRVLCEAVQEFFPQLRPGATVNIEHPHCWNKDGQASALETWLSKVSGGEVAPNHNATTVRPSQLTDPLEPGDNDHHGAIEQGAHDDGTAQAGVTGVLIPDGRGESDAGAEGLANSVSAR